jgi:hypothetical protein
MIPSRGTWEECGEDLETGSVARNNSSWRSSFYLRAADDQFIFISSPPATSSPKTIQLHDQH